MTEFVRTDDANFDALGDWPYEPRYHQWKDLRVHYVDEGPKDGPVALLVHGMPTWGYLYRTMIPALVDAGFRCIAPDHLGFGRSDKPTDASWYSIARHTEVLTSLINSLDLRQITVFVQDWAGPIGLAQAATMPDRFEKLVIMNTWLHHEGFEYPKSIQNWIKHQKPGGRYDLERPRHAVLVPLGAGLLDPETAFGALGADEEPEFEGEAATMYDAFAAPFLDLPDEAYNGLRWFPLSIPHNDYDSGNGAAQELHYRLLLEWDKPVQFIWGGLDQMFTEEWGSTWAERMDAPIHVFDDANHFLQTTHGSRIVDLVLADRP